MYSNVSKDDFSMSMNEAADYFESVTGRRLPVSNLYRWVQQGALKAHKLGGRYYTGRQAIDAFITEWRAGAAEQAVPARPQPPVTSIKVGLHDRVDSRRTERIRSEQFRTNDEAKEFLRRRLTLDFLLN